MLHVEAAHSNEEYGVGVRRIFARRLKYELDDLELCFL